MKRASTKKSRRVSSAKIIGVISAMIVIVATVMAFALPGASALSTANDVMPSVIAGRGEYNFIPVLDFEEDGWTFKESSNNIDAVGLKADYPKTGNNVHFCTYSAGKSADQADAVSPKTDVQWNGEYDGLMVWFDATAASDKDGGFLLSPKFDIKDGSATYQGMRVTTNKMWTAYYCLDGTDTWVPTANHDQGNRFLLPAGKSGWVYFPEEVFAAEWGSTPQKGTRLSNIDSGNIINIQFYCSELKGDSACTIYFDNFGLVDLGGGDLPATVPTTGVDATSAYVADFRETFGATSKVTSFSNAANGVQLSANKSGSYTLTYNYNDGTTGNNGSGANTARGQGYFNYTKANGKDGGDTVLKFDKGTDGIMWYVDASTAPSDNSNANYSGMIGVGLRFISVYYGNDYRKLADNTGANLGSAGSATAYYYDISAAKWTKTTNIDSDRIGVPGGFEGYVYVPFSSYKTNNGYLLSNVVDTYNIYVPNVFVLTSAIDADASANVQMVIDNIIGVKYRADGRYVESSAPTTLPTGQSFNSSLFLDFDTKSLASNPGQTKFDRATFYYGKADATGNKAAVLAGVHSATPEQTMAVNQTLSKGMTGIMFYLNTTELEGYGNGLYNEYTGMADGMAETDYLAFGVRLNATSVGSSSGGQFDADNNVGYYYTDGQWHKTNSITGNNRMAIPAGFEGYVYVPFSSYKYNSGTKLTLDQYLENGDTVIVKNTFFLTTNLQNNLEWNARNDIYIDNVQFVTPTTVAVSNSASIPELPDYIVGGATGLASYTTTDFVNFEGNQGFIRDSNNGSFNLAESNVAKQPGEWKGLDMALNTDAAKNDTELVLDYSADSGQGVVGFRNAISMNSVLAGEGIMFHVDISGIKSTKATASYVYNGKTYTIENAIGFSVDLYTSEGTYTTGGWETYPSVYAVDVFFAEDGADTWKATSNLPIASNSRFALPADFSGWVYIPFTSFIKGTPDVNLSDVASANLNGIRFYSCNNNPDPAKDAQIVLDDFMGVTLGAGRALPEADWSDVEAIAAGMVTTDGANIRVGVDNAGIRFQTIVTANDAYNKCFPNGFDPNNAIGFGMLLIPTDVLGSGKLDHTNEDVLDIKAEKVVETDTGFSYTATLTDIPWTWYSKSITAIAYVGMANSYNVDGSLNYSGICVGTDGTANTPVVRSYMDVVYAAIEDGNDTEQLYILLDTPTALPSGSNFAGAQLVTDFSDNYASHKNNISGSTNKGYGALVGTDAGAASGLGFKVTSYATAVGEFAKGTHSPETSSIALRKNVSVDGYSGLLFYVDTTELTPSNGKVAVAVPFTLVNSSGGTKMLRSYATDKTGDARVGTGYYFIGGAWVATQPNGATADRMYLPGGFAGWVYIPFSSYYSANNSTSKTSFEYWVDQGYNKITTLTLFTGNCSTHGSIVFDSCYLVK